MNKVIEITLLNLFCGRVATEGISIGYGSGVAKLFEQGIYVRNDWFPTTKLNERRLFACYGREEE